MNNSEVENIQVRKTRSKLEIMKSEVQFEVRNNNLNSENKVGKRPEVERLHYPGTRTDPVQYVKKTLLSIGYVCELNFDLLARRHIFSGCFHLQ